MVFCISAVSVVISPFSFLILFVWVLSLLFLVGLARGFSILFTFSMNQLLVSLIFSIFSLNLYFTDFLFDQGGRMMAPAWFVFLMMALACWHAFSFPCGLAGLSVLVLCNMSWVRWWGLR